MRDNPLHIQAFGPQAEHRRRGLARFFEPVLHRAFNRGSVFGLVNDDVLVGVYVETPPGSCKLGVVEKLKIFPSIYFCNSLTTSVRVLNWTGEWSRRDPAEPHWNFGPVAVDASLQGRGIGSTMLSDFCSPWTHGKPSLIWRPTRAPTFGSTKSSDSRYWPRPKCLACRTGSCRVNHHCSGSSAMGLRSGVLSAKPTPAGGPRYARILRLTGYLRACTRAENFDMVSPNRGSIRPSRYPRQKRLRREIVCLQPLT
jgi:hypothetical protein